MARYSRDGADFGAILRMPGVRAAVIDVTEQVGARARSFAPVDDGDYLRGIETTLIERGGNDRDRPEGRVTATAPHSAAVEWGNSRSRGRHVLARALYGR
ncbi:MAG: hypothetical protein AVDCRST_MAG68-5035 [uncultured Gemmatimonadetes bacterium]|uniref:Uncharacterized protein n=1 Tax=uncultured Gemmatimonadota bacterium TaxID=203437 RepID=A0A6J4MNK5_9BACT|nr:MAG: hypothetical protein AVDCRST_MAG68-5035 [uncultured Gemmatimonadota bacterium]